MTETINTAFERLNTPRAIFDEKITKMNLIPVLEEVKDDDDLDWILYEISEADYFNDMSWIITKLDKNYPKTRRFLENIIENVKKEYQSTDITDLCDVIADKLTNVRSTSPYLKKHGVYTVFASFLECDDALDYTTVTILNGSHYLERTIDDLDRYCIRSIYDIFEDIDKTCNAEPIALDTMTNEARRYYNALAGHVDNGEHLMPIELEFLERELKKGNPNDTH
jgi:hypothetical protein